MPVEKPRLYWVVGELSGENHAVGLLQALRARLPQAEHRGMGGSRMAELGVSLVANWEAYAVVGFVEVVRHLGRFVELYRRLLRDIAQWRPHRVILVDYPGLNLRLARRLVRQGIPVTYFIPPQVWAWNTQRVRYLRHPLMQVLVILPFEVEFYARHGVQAVYVGHPLVEQLRDLPPFEVDQPFIALLPGSREAEVRQLLPRMAQLAERMPEWRFYVSQVPHLPQALYERLAPNLPRFVGPAPVLLKAAAAAVVASGTASLEAALLGCPSVIAYRGSWISYWIARSLVRVPYIGLPNLILGKRVFPELIQGRCTPQALQQALQQVLQHREAIRAELARLQQVLGSLSASETAAEYIVKTLQGA
ncbi:MAG: lipid-A-disaccharide synthase [Bacteroidetes bacterium]|nr:MAG: lipid-A-disaccharide synthase [Bacteroidota bacterium]